VLSRFSLTNDVVDPDVCTRLGDFPAAGLLGKDGFCAWGEKTGSLVWEGLGCLRRGPTFIG
jgi:hypothetical protein